MKPIEIERSGKKKKESCVRFSHPCCAGGASKINSPKKIMTKASYHPQALADTRM
jgi:hypothetical protein